VPAGRFISSISAGKNDACKCELCGLTATVGCDRCNTTFYWFVFPNSLFEFVNDILTFLFWFSGKEHQHIDWFGIHEKICPLLAPLRTAPPVVSSEDERLRRNLTIKMSQVLIDFVANK
jgi:hypothetical protein